MIHYDPRSALSRLQPGEMCGLMLTNGQEREGEWNPNLPGFELCDEKGTGIVFLPDIEEWWPAGVQF